MKTIEIAVGIAIRETDSMEVLVAQRLQGSHLAGSWEFPGGKIDSGESPESALVREFSEELAVKPTHFEMFTQIDHRYPEREVSLSFYLVTQLDGEPVGAEGQRIAWVNMAELAELDVPAANQPIIEKLQAYLGRD
ncbi:8-oxo-dGTP diphosphatase MutT [Corallincola luteus]|uniref:8-oxo-dGTP diphosphatase n=1 Tax=Corallincola luteus TaxID=1775177 RepID=A0ABY2AKZ8_9GAMM|nr:8-oxo-dGTP diphosphatase MutT [Corallincola luteus]TCI03597.1 8-oxo-dGTP diphosphatase MutT [Corallincola luteus]